MNERIAYLQMIQSVIARMSRNSFLIKGWSISVVAALTALVGAEASTLVYLPVLPAAMFWGLDAFFLRQERLFRELWKCASGPDGRVNFCMETERYNNAVGGIGKIVISKTLLWFHATITGVVVILAIAR